MEVKKSTSAFPYEKHKSHVLSYPRCNLREFMPKWQSWKVQVISKNIYKGKYSNNLLMINLYSLWNLDFYNLIAMTPRYESVSALY